MVNWSLQRKIISGILLLFLLSITLHVIIIRPWYLEWGATPDEQVMSLPGDPFIPSDSDVTTRAITIQASPAEI